MSSQPVERGEEVGEGCSELSGCCPGPGCEAAVLAGRGVPTWPSQALLSGVERLAVLLKAWAEME